MKFLIGTGAPIEVCTAAPPNKAMHLTALHAAGDRQAVRPLRSFRDATTQNRMAEGLHMRLAFLIGISAILFTACSTGPAITQKQVTDERAIQEIAANFASAWNRHDMRAFSELCTEDADFVVITGRHLKGREDIFTYHDALHKGSLRTAYYLRSSRTYGSYDPMWR